MTTTSATWFVAQLSLLAVMIWTGRRLARARPRLARALAIAATISVLAWPLMRLYPARTLARLGTAVLMYIEVTGIVIPAVLLFSLAAYETRRARFRRLIQALLAVCVAYFLHHGWWMIARPVPDLGTCWLRGDTCYQSTPYTCVAASLVTLLRHHGIPATETQMARLSHTQVRGGTTDTRAVHALQHKLAGSPWKVRYAVMDYARLCRAPMPCVVSVRWGYAVSHMVPVLAADHAGVTLADPLTGVRHCTRQQFLADWHKRGIYLQPRSAPRGRPRPSDG
jgi:hypothetical protein